MRTRVRRFDPADRDGCGAVYFDAVRNGTAPFYTADQARAWAPTQDPAEWADRLSAGRTWVAERDGTLAGFITFAPGGHLDLFFVRPAFRGQGLADTLYRAGLADAIGEGHAHLTTHASELARRFLERRGWHVTATEDPLRNGIRLRRFEMVLDLPPA